MPKRLGREFLLKNSPRIIPFMILNHFSHLRRAIVLQNKRTSHRYMCVAVHDLTHTQLHVRWPEQRKTTSQEKGWCCIPMCLTKPLSTSQNCLSTQNPSQVTRRGSLDWSGRPHWYQIKSIKALSSSRCEKE